MAFFGSDPVVEDHGAALLEELEEFHAAHAERVEKRRNVVQSRLAALEAEHADLDEAKRRLKVVETFNAA